MRKRILIPDKLRSRAREFNEEGDGFLREFGRSKELRSDADVRSMIADQLREVFLIARRAWDRERNEDALKESVALCRMCKIREPRWVREALTKVGREVVSGAKRRKKKPGTRADFLSNHYFFTVVQNFRDARPDHRLKQALVDAHEELEKRGTKISIDTLESIYKSHRRLVTLRDGRWFPRVGTYFPRGSDLFWSLPSEF